MQFYPITCTINILLAVSHYLMLTLSVFRLRPNIIFQIEGRFLAYNVICYSNLVILYTTSFKPAKFAEYYQKSCKN